MSKTSKLRIAPGAEGVSIWSEDLFAEPGAARLREFLARAFAVPEVEAVDIRRADAFGRVRYGRAAIASATEIWRKLGESLRGDEATAVRPAASRGRRNAGAARDAVGVEGLFLDHPARWPIRVSRVGETLSSWRVRPDGDDQIRLTHPVLRHRRSIGFRLEEQLASIFGVEDFRARSFSSDVLVRFDRRVLTPERLVRELEKAWPALIDSVDEPPSSKRLFAAGTLLGLAAAGQFAVPALRPIAVGAVVVYSAPNVAAAVRQLRRGQVGLPALYSFGLGLMLLSGLPLTGTIMASLMQLWPYLAHRTIVNRQRRLFSAHRKRPIWARVPGSQGVEIEVHVDDLKPGDEVVVRRGEVVPVDGVVSQGLAAIVDNAAHADTQDVTPGDAVYAGALVRDGEVIVRVERSGEATAAAHIGATLPHSAFRDLPSLIEAERIGNRNARPALALATLNLLTIRAPRFSQAVIRPDYVTAPRLSAQLTALYDLADGLRRGLLFRRPAALDLISDIDVFVFDDTAGLERRGLEVARVAAVEASVDETLAYALAGIGAESSERTRALSAFLARRPKPQTAAAHDLRRRAGAILFRDEADRQIALVSPGFLQKIGVALPDKLKPSDDANATPSTRPLFVVRDGRPIGVVTFRRQGEPGARGVIDALKAQNPQARFVHVSGKRKSTARATASAAGVEFSFGNLDAGEKAAVIRGFGRRTIWVGDGSAAGAATAMAASEVTASTAGVAGAPHDAADVLLLRGSIAGLTELRSLGLAHRARLQSDYRAVYAANLVGVAGAFLANFGSLQAGLLSNLGSGVVYGRHLRRLNGLIAEIEAERTRLARIF